MQVSWARFALLVVEYGEGTNIFAFFFNNLSWFHSVLSTADETTGLCFVTILAGYWAEGRTNAPISFGIAQRLSTQKGLCAVYIFIVHLIHRYRTTHLCHPIFLYDI